MSKPLMRDQLLSQIEYQPVERLKPYGRNARTHPKKQIAQLAAAIQQFGFVVPIVVAEEGTILAGHARLDAAIQLGMKEVPTIRVAHLSEAERRAFVIADNRLSQLSEWDLDILSAELCYLEHRAFNATCILRL